MDLKVGLSACASGELKASGADGGSLQEQIQELISYPRESTAKRWLDLEGLVEPGKIGV